VVHLYADSVRAHVLINAAPTRHSHGEQVIRVPNALRRYRWQRERHAGKQLAIPVCESVPALHE
jgi:hypothetical protein